MKYKDYIDLGFTRIDLSDNVEFTNTGYHGFCLEKVLSEKVQIVVNYGELDKPKMYIKKGYSETYHIITINEQIVTDLLCEPNNCNPFTRAC
jgi:hypothetical protein